MSDYEKGEYQSLAGTLMSLGNAVLPQAAYATSQLQQHPSGLRVKHILEENEILSEIMRLNPGIRYNKPGQIESTTVITISDASHGVQGSEYFQNGGLSDI